MVRSKAVDPSYILWWRSYGIRRQPFDAQVRTNLMHFPSQLEVLLQLGEFGVASRT